MENKYKIHPILDVVLLVFLTSGCGHELYGSNDAVETGISPPQSTQRVEKYVYKQTPQGELEIFVHFPKNWDASDKRPAIVFFFGGGWLTGKVKQFVPQAKYLAGRGMVTARADYRVKNRHGTSPDKCVEDGKSAVRWLRINATKLGVDPNRIVASGHSAGGHIAASTCTIKGLEAQEEDLSVSSKANLLVLFEPALACVPNVSLGLGWEMAAKMTLYHNLSKEVPPAFLYYGTNDYVLVVAGIDFIEKSKKLGNIVEVYTAEGQIHWAFQRSPWLERTIYVTDKFLARHGYTQGEPTIKLPEGKVELNNMSDTDLNAYAEDKLGNTPLHRAARHGQKELAELLIFNGSEVDARDKWEITPLHFAAAHGHKELVELLTANGADVNAKNEQGFTPLAFAGLKDIVEMLLSKGADVNARDNRGATPLHRSASLGEKEKVEFLIRKGAEINVEASDGATPLFHAAVNGHADIVELLINRGADINLSMHEGATPIAMANRRGQTEVVNILRRHGALETLHGAAASGDEEEVKRLVAQGADLNARNQNGQTPLHLALKHGSGTVFLISQGADVNAKDQAGRTPLMMAAIRGREYLAEVLIVQGADVNAKANKGETALSLAKENGEANIVELLLKHGARSNNRDMPERM